LSQQFQDRFFKTHVCGGTLATTVAAHISTMHPGDPIGAAPGSPVDCVGQARTSTIEGSRKTGDLRA